MQGLRETLGSARSKEPIKTQTEVIGLDPETVSLRRLDDGSWRLVRSGEDFAAIGDDSELAWLLGHEWAQPMRVGSDLGDISGEVWLYRGRWFRLQLPDTPESHEVDETNLCRQLARLAEGFEEAEERRFDELVELLPPSDEQGFASKVRSSWGALRRFGDDPFVGLRAATDDEADIVARTAVNPDIPGLGDDPDDEWVFLARDNSGMWRANFAYSSDDLVEKLNEQAGQPQFMGLHPDGGVFFAYRSHLVHAELPDGAVTPETYGAVRILGGALVTLDEAYDSPGTHPFLRRFEDLPLGDEGSLGSDAAGRPDVGEEDSDPGDVGEEPTPPRSAWLPVAEAASTEGEEPLEVVVGPADSLLMLPASPAEGTGRWCLSVREPSRTTEYEPDVVTVDTAELRAIVAEQATGVPVPLGTLRGSPSWVAWLVRGHLVYTRLSRAYSPQDESAAQLLDGSRRTLYADERFSTEPVTPLGALDHPILDAPRRNPAARTPLNVGAGPDSGSALALAASDEIFVQRNSGPTFFPWVAVFGEGRVPSRVTFGSAPEDFIEPSSAPEHILPYTGIGTDRSFAQVLDDQWGMPHALAVDAGEEVLWLYRGWFIVSPVPPDLPALARTQRDIVVRVHGAQSSNLDVLRAWRAEASGQSLVTGGLASQVVAGAGPRDITRADDADWVRLDPPAAPSLHEASVLSDDEVTVHHGAEGWVITHRPTGQPIMSDRDHDLFLHMLREMEETPSFVGFLQGESVWLFRGRLVRLRDGEAATSREFEDFKRDGVLSVLVFPDAAEPAEAGEWAEAREALEALQPPDEDLEDLDLAPPPGRREHIPQREKDKVWRRDEGRCVQCGSQERLEFDHIIPFSLGGSNTARNLQLLCQTCNRKKGANI